MIIMKKNEVQWESPRGINDFGGDIKESKKVSVIFWNDQEESGIIGCPRFQACPYS